VKYIVIADAHVGASDKVELLMSTLTKYRASGHRVLWLGDNFDVIMKSDVETFYPDMIHPEDIKIIGNHDWNDSGLRSVAFERSRTIFLHGDLVDFGYGAMRFSPLNPKKNFIERLVSKFRRWSMNDVYILYKEMDKLGDSEVASFHKGVEKFKHTWSYLRLIFNILRHPTTPLAPAFGPIPELVGGHFFNYVTDRPEELVKRILCLYPNVKDMDTIVIGHLHVSIDAKVNVYGKDYRIICLDAWTEGNKPDILIINESGEILEGPTNQF